MLEVMIFVSLAGIMYVAVSQMIPKKQLSHSIDELVLGLNSLAAQAAQEAVCKSLPAQLEFKPSKNGYFQVRAKIVQQQEINGKRQFAQIDNGFVLSKLAFPRELDLVAWQVGTSVKGKDETTLVLPFSAQGVGLSSILHLKTRDRDQERQFSLVFNPFTCHFKLQDQFVPFVVLETS